MDFGGEGRRITLGKLQGIQGTAYLFDLTATVRVMFSMARLSRIVVPGVPLHVTQRGNRPQDSFFCEDDYRLYRDLMAEWCERCEVEVWAYCLMTNHVHLLTVPSSTDALSAAIGEAHRRDTRAVYFHQG